MLLYIFLYTSNIHRMLIGVCTHLAAKTEALIFPKPNIPVSTLLLCFIGDDISIKSANVKLNINNVCNLISVSSERFN
jgi:hypothetical protein